LATLILCLKQTKIFLRFGYWCLRLAPYTITDACQKHNVTCSWFI